MRYFVSTSPQRSEAVPPQERCTRWRFYVYVEYHRLGNIEHFPVSVRILISAANGKGFHIGCWCTSVADTIASPFVNLNSRTILPSLTFTSKCCWYAVGGRPAAAATHECGSKCSSTCLRVRQRVAMTMIAPLDISLTFPWVCEARYLSSVQGRDSWSQSMFVPASASIRATEDTPCIHSTILYVAGLGER
jgi:hypothetical protein